MLGTVSPQELGVTLPHEHLLLDFTVATMPPTYGCCDLANTEIVMQNLGKIRQYPYAHIVEILNSTALNDFIMKINDCRYSVTTNMILDDEDEIIEELKMYKKAGGETVCDVTSSGIQI